MQFKKVILVGVLLSFVRFISAHGEINELYNDHHGMMSGAFGHSGMWGMWLFGGLFMILVTIALVLLILWLIKHINKK